MIKDMNILEKIKQELRANIDEKYREGCQRYYKEKIVCYGVRTPVVRRIATNYFKQIKGLNKKEMFALSDELFKNKYNEEATIAVQWVRQLSKQFEMADFEIFKKGFYKG